MVRCRARLQKLTEKDAYIVTVRLEWQIKTQYCLKVITKSFGAILINEK
jgi:hypothetical protein